MNKLPANIIFKVQEYESLAAIYPEIPESKRDQWLEQKIKERAYTPDDRLIYKVNDNRLGTYYVIIDVKAGEIITNITIKTEGLFNMASTIPLEGLTREYVTNKDYMKFIRHIYVHGIRISELTSTTDLSTAVVENWRLKFQGDSPNNITEEELKAKLPELITLTDSLDASIVYPDAMKWFYPRNKIPVHFLNGCFKILYQLATVNRYWSKHTYYMLDMEPKVFKNITLMPQDFKI